MRFNDHALRQVAKTVRPDKEGRLNYRAPKDSEYIAHLFKFSRLYQSHRHIFHLSTG